MQLIKIASELTLEKLFGVIFRTPMTVGWTMVFFAADSLFSSKKQIIFWLVGFI